METLLESHQLYQYILDNSLKQTPNQTALYRKASEDQYSKMITPPEQLQFLSLLIKILGVKKMIEVGVFRGVGTLGMSLALPEDGCLYACDITDEYLNGYQYFWDNDDVSHKIKLKISPATETLKALISDGHENTFDFAYIDADKENYMEYYQLTHQLLKKGGVMVFDNMLWGGRVINLNDNDKSTIAIRNLNKYILNDNTIEASLLPIGDGINIIRKL
jgi:caffeoyl-CoA O-methyltransferase